jgi:hypothetical protein
MGCYNNGYMSNGGGNTVTVTEHDTSTYTQVSSITGLRKMVYSLENQDVHRYRNVDRHIQLVSQPSSGLHHFIIFTQQRPDRNRPRDGFPHEDEDGGGNKVSPF